MKKGKYFQQFHQPQLYHHDCGLACLKMICNYHYIPVDYQHLLQQFLGLKGINMLNLQKIADSLGFKVTSYKWTHDAINQLQYPCILIAQEDENYHAVTCFDYHKKEQTLYIGDPKIGQIQLLELGSLSKYKFAIQFEKTEEKSNFSAFIAGNQPFLTFIKRIGKQHQITYLRFLFLSVMAGIFTFAITIYIQKMVDQAHHQAHINNALAILSLILLLLLIKSALEYFFKLLWINYQKDISITLYDSLFQHFSFLPSKTSYTLEKGDYLAAINDLNYSITAHQIIIQFFLSDMLLMIFYCLICAYYSVPILLIILCSSVFPIYFILRKSPLLLALFENNRQTNVYAMNSFLAHIKTLRFSPATNLNPLLLHRTQQKFQHYYQEKYQTLKVAQHFTFLQNCLMAVTSGLIIYYLFLSLEQQKLSIGAFSSLLSVIFILLQMLYRSFKLPITLKEYLPSVQRCNQQLITRTSSLKTNYKKDFKTIIISNYTLKHPQGAAKPLINQLNLTIKKHSLTVLTGANGCGKSYLLHTLLGYATPATGKIFLDKEEVEQLPKDGFTSFMPQKTELLDGTLGFNIALSENKDTQAIIRFCEYFGMVPFLNQFPKGLDTYLGVDGFHLSQGQITLIVLLRSIYSKPQLIILDEPSSFLSLELQEYLIQLLTILKQKSTLLIVTHEAKIIALADQVCDLSHLH